jgi:hypothetical protein
VSVSDVGREPRPSPFGSQAGGPGTAAAVAPKTEAVVQEPAVPGTGTHVQAPGEFRIDWFRSEGLRLAVQLFAHQEHKDDPSRDSLTERVIDTGGHFAAWLGARPARISVGDPVITDQGHPAQQVPLNRTGADMAVTIKDTQIATYPAPEALDSKGFEVSDTITVSEDSAGAVVAMTANADGTTSFAAVAPGAAQVSWTDGTLSFADTINVTAGDAASIVVGAPVVTDQAPATPPPAG